MASPCYFFANAGCKRDSRCPYLHKDSPNTNKFLHENELRGSAAAFVPGSPPAIGIPIAPTNVPATSKIRCHFFSQGTCKNGLSCKFSHEQTIHEQASPFVTTTAIPNTVSRDITLDEVITQLPKSLDLHQESRNLRGAEVLFQDGAEVSSMRLSTSSSVSSERYQLSTVSCSWYKLSKTAWLHYHRHRSAALAITKFGVSHKVNGRTVQAQLCENRKPFVHNSIWSVRLGNLSVDTRKADLLSALSGLVPNDIIFGQRSHSMSETQVCSLVEGLLSEYGTLESFETSQGVNASRMKALARFTNAADARTAASQLSGKKITIAGKPGANTLFVNLTASVKFLVLGPLYEIVKVDIRKAQSEFECVRINAYPPEREGKPVVIRLIGQDLRTVSRAKIVFERITKGTTILDENGLPCWDDHFVSPTGFDYIKALSQPSRVFVYRDTRKRQLVVHGSSQAFEGTRQAVLVKLKELSDMIHVLPLTQTLLSQALSGAFRRILDTLGRDVVKLDVATKPPSIVVRGNASVLATVQNLLLSPLEDHRPSEKESSSNNECQYV